MQTTPDRNMKGYDAISEPRENHNHKRCILWRTPYIFGWNLYIHYGCQGHNIMICKRLNNKFGMNKFSIKLPYKNI